VSEVTLQIEGYPVRQVSHGTPFLDVVQTLGKAKGILAVSIDGKPTDLSTPIDRDTVATLITFDSPEGREIYRHSSAHLMAQAVKELFPAAQMAIGPAIEDGFYYDFDVERPFSLEDLQAIETRMIEITRRNLSVHRMEISKEEAKALFHARGENYKVELIDDIDTPPISAYQQGEFIDLCMGPHVPSTGAIHAIKLTAIAGAYWRGSEKNKMLQRIYGTSFFTQAALDAHLAKLEEIKKRDHRKIGRDLDLFSISDKIGPGLILWHPKGAIIRRVMEDFWRDAHTAGGYELVFTPHMARLDLWRESGHLDFYRENMFSPMEVEGVPYEIKPMNCPFHIQIYKTALRSYRDLPFRWAELGTVYRYERSGVLHGLLRVRGFTQDDAHLFCRPDQIEGEILGILDFVTMVLNTFGFTEYDVYLSTRPEKYVGSLDRWAQATDALESALKRKGLAYTVDPGEGVFYGPKIDLKIKDMLGRSWQCSTIQVDFNLPERFGMTYRDETGGEQQPIMIHRALLGSLERFFGVLIEHYAGAFPVWLSPVQVTVIPIAERHHAYAKTVFDELTKAKIRAHFDDRNEKMGFKIREAQTMKVPYMLVIGDREAAEGCVSVRNRQGESTPLPTSDFVSRTQDEITRRQ
jgi:threonyl-tRNA synthetase